MWPLLGSLLFETYGMSKPDYADDGGSAFDEGDNDHEAHPFFSQY
jgi:hypothetical protein